MQILNLDKVRRSHQHFLANHARMVDTVLQEAELTRDAQREVSAGDAPKNRTGNLILKTKARVVRTAGGKLVKIQNRAKYAHAQDGGSGLHGPRKARYMIPGKPFLRFMWHGVLTYRRYVMHPGVKPTKFLFHATQRVAVNVGKQLRSGMTKVARQF